MEHHTIENLKATVNAARDARRAARSLESQGYKFFAANSRELCRVYMASAHHIAATLKERAATVDTAMARDAQERAAVKSALIGMVKSGEYIRRTATAKRVYIRGEYVRALRAYECQAADDMNSVIYIKSTKLVFFGFTY